MILRRSQQRASYLLTVRDLTAVDLSQQRISCAGRRIDLTQTELSLLVVLLRHSPNPVAEEDPSQRRW